MKYEILNEQGEVINTILADLAFVEEHHAGQYREVVEPAAEPQGSWDISKRAFKARFPRAKWIAAKTAASVDPTLADFFEDFELSSYINVKDPVTVAAVTALSAPSVPVDFQLTTEEVEAVLNVPTQPGEEP